MLYLTSLPIACRHRALVFTLLQATKYHALSAKAKQDSIGVQLALPHAAVHTSSAACHRLELSAYRVKRRDCRHAYLCCLSCDRNASTVLFIVRFLLKCNSHARAHQRHLTNCPFHRIVPHSIHANCKHQSVQIRHVCRGDLPHRMCVQ